MRASQPRGGAGDCFRPAPASMFRPVAVPFDVYNAGVPPEDRARVWYERSGAADKRDRAGEGYYAALVAADAPRTDRAQIKKVRAACSHATELWLGAGGASTVTRVFSVQDVKRSGVESKAEQEVLERVLMAYSQRNKVVGYCQVRSWHHTSVCVGAFLASSQ